ncbi:iron ABC transporter permease [Knoellia locipacati]|uniref:ABC transporter permease n=1 Tax=Knoellia locipacati TaxID=882824 RepID=A0A512SZ45_9MICO|nr:iron ABC transporter permease [Knoellia locipacati]GEQ13230.1 ABC transporter permease [Knoellia locipacati]
MSAEVENARPDAGGRPDAGERPRAGDSRAARLSGTGRPWWSALVVVIALVVSVPVVSVLVQALASAGDLALPGNLGEMVVTTVALLALVGLGTSVLGVGLAWLVTAYDFPGRRLFSWMLVLPLAMPAYVLGFLFLSTFGPAGGPAHASRSVFGGSSVVELLSGWMGAPVVLSLTLYPYVYLLARAAFRGQGQVTWDAARMLGATPWRAFRQVLLPLARPALAGGLAVVMMETLTDFATVQYFGVRTVSVGVYLTWKGTFDFASAAQLSVLVLAFAVMVLTGERLLRGGARYDARGSHRPPASPTVLTGAGRWWAFAAAASVLAAGFVLPVLQLLWWAVTATLADSSSLSTGRFATNLTNSAVMAALAALACVTLALLVTHGVRMTGGRLARTAAQLTTFGYAVPGAVIGIGVLVSFAALDRSLEALGVPGGTGLVVTGSVIGLLASYVVRFLAPAYQAVDASFATISPSVTNSAFSLGASPLRVLRRVHLPLSRSGIAVALVLVAVDAVKELPLVLLLRPFGFTTVSVWVYELANENFWEQAALPALLIVALAIIPVWFLVRQVRLAEPHRQVTS